jgi:hypothetical protein
MQYKHALPLDELTNHDIPTNKYPTESNKIDIMRSYFLEISLEAKDVHSILESSVWSGYVTALVLTNVW